MAYLEGSDLGDSGKLTVSFAAVASAAITGMIP